MKFQAFLSSLVICLFAATASAISVRWDIPTAGGLTGEELLDGASSVYIVSMLTEESSAETVLSKGTKVEGGSISIPLVAGSTVAGDGLSLTSKSYYYLVVFTGGSSFDDPKSYAVYRAAQYTGDPTTDTKNGYYQNAADPAIPPELGDYVDLTFVGHVVPEPTVLALLALGVAGFVLRRKA